MPDDDAVRLLLKAVDTLPEGERTEVLAFLVGRGLGLGSGTGSFISLSSSLQPAGFPGRPPTGEQQMVPVRFGVEQHQRLRSWCGDHGFSMAVVVRGLVDRFLDEQAAPAA